MRLSGLRKEALAALLGLAFGVGGCRGSASLQPASAPANHAETVPPAPAAKPAPPPPAPVIHVSEAEALKPRDDLPPEQRALVVVDGKERWVDAAAIESAGYTLIDLRDDWTPFIFAEQKTPEGEPLPNRYRRIFIGLANDQLDNDGEPLAPGEKNYLELYGIFPSLSVLRARFMSDAESACHDQQSADVLDAVETVTYVAPKDIKRDEHRLARIRDELELARRKGHFHTLDDLAAKKPELSAKVKLLAKRAAEKPAMAAVEQRLTCEGLLTPKSKHQAGIYDDAMRLAVRHFQQKHMIYEANYLRRQTVDALAKPPLDNDFESLSRALRERVVSAAGILEDGSSTSAKTGVHDLVDEYAQVAREQLGLTDGPSALAFFQRHPDQDFRTLRAAVKLPARPDYYSDGMDLSIVVDRGDIWYDPPFDEKGNYKPQARKKYPSLTLYETYQGKKFALAHWRTTIGGWRAEQASDGYEYFRYKQSDVGPRVIRQVVSGPVWIPPASTPIRSLIKGKTVNKKWMKVVNYEEFGPGFYSAYGLIAGYFVVPGQNGRNDFDNGVRAHGSSDYLSIYSANGYSHGCHRLPNHIAIRLYSFILKHRHMNVGGDQPMNFSRQFLSGETVFEIRVPSRGYAFYLDPPLPVNVLEGDIKGQVKKPILGYIPEPWAKYPGPPPPAPDSPEAKAGGGGE